MNSLSSQALFKFAITEQTLRFIHTSDWHLGMTRHFLKGEAQARYTQDRIDLIPALGQLAVEQKAAFIVVCGDLFDSNQVAPQTVIRSVEKLQRLPLPVFILPGNHDPLNAASVYDSNEFKSLPEHIIVLRDSRVHRVPGIPGVEVVGAPWHHKQALSDLCATMLKSLEPVSDGVVRIGLAHGQIDALQPDTENPATLGATPIQQALNDNKIQYLALGDRHSLTEADESGRVWYSGTPVVTDFSEKDPNQVLLVDATVGIDPRPRVEPLVLGDWHFRTLSERVDGFDDIERLGVQLAAIENKERTVIKLALQGTLRLNENIALETMLESNSNLFASLRRHERRSDVAVVADELDSEQLSLTGYARTSWDELAEAASAEGPDADSARGALELLYRLAGTDTAHPVSSAGVQSEYQTHSGSTP